MSTPPPPAKKKRNPPKKKVRRSPGSMVGWATGQEYLYTESTYLAAGQANTPKAVPNRFQPSKLSFRDMLKARKKIARAFKTHFGRRFEVAEQGCLLKFP